MGDESNDGVRQGPESGRRLVDDKSVVFVGGINWKASESELLEFFNDAIGPAIHCRIIFDRETNRSKGYGFVTFASPELARDAKETDPPLVFMGKTLNCQSAYRRSPPTPPPWPSPSPAINQSSYPYYPTMLVDQMGMVYVAQTDGLCYYPTPSWGTPSFVNPSLIPQEPYFRYPAALPRAHGESRPYNRDKARFHRNNDAADNAYQALKRDPQFSQNRGGEHTQPKQDPSEGNTQQS